MQRTDLKKNRIKMKIKNIQDRSFLGNLQSSQTETKTETKQRPNRSNHTKPAKTFQVKSKHAFPARLHSLDSGYSLSTSSWYESPWQRRSSLPRSNRCLPKVQICDLGRMIGSVDAGPTEYLVALWYTSAYVTFFLARKRSSAAKPTTCKGTMGQTSSLESTIYKSRTDCGISQLSKFVKTQNPCLTEGCFIHCPFTLAVEIESLNY